MNKSQVFYGSLVLGRGQMDLKSCWMAVGGLPYVSNEINDDVLILCYWHVLPDYLLHPLDLCLL